MIELHATVGADIAIHGADERTKARVLFAFTVPNPKHLTAERFGHKTTEPEELEFAVDMPDGSLRVPRGAIQKLKDVLREKCDATLKVTRDDRVFSDGFPYFEVSNLYPHQEEGVSKILSHTQGIVVLPCGTGKTILAVATISRIGGKALVVVPTIDIMRQWATNISEILGERPGVLGGGSTDSIDADIVVAVDDALVSYLGRVPDYAKRFGTLIVDEAHHCACPTLRRLVGACPAKYRVALTATPERADGLSEVIEWLFGPKLLEKTTKEMVAIGVLIPAEIEFVETEWTFADRRVYQSGPPPKTREEKQALARAAIKESKKIEAAIALSSSRTALIAQRVAEDVRHDHSILVLANRKKMCDALMNATIASGIDPKLVEVVTSAKKGKKRESAMERFRSGELCVLIATSLADEGLDVRRLSRIHMAFPEGGRTATTQRLGRLLRKWPGKKPKLIDYVDKVFTRRTSERKSVYKEAGMIE